MEFDAHVFAPEFNLVGREIRVVISDVLWGTPKRCTTPDMKSITGPDSAVLTGLASIHLVNLSTMTQ